MKYASVDIETTGLNPRKHQILEVGIIVEDTKMKSAIHNCPAFHCYIDHETIIGDAYALQMNAAILKKICDLRISDPCNMLLKPEAVPVAIGRFLFQTFGHVRPTAAGKNAAGFDLPFLYELPMASERFGFAHRVLDPSSLFVNFSIDEKLPDAKECKVRAGVPGEVLHNSLDDAWDIIQVLRTRY